ncbi:MAG TPA: thioredoxin family protein [Dehalococcoidia bacterium]|nr:thioredoxin family protein [Dehalococcoidia bacterium]
MALEIYIEAGCSSCGRALALAQEVAQLYPGLIVEVVDISETERSVPDSVFAVPTYVLDGKVVSLGNPSPTELTSMIESALAGRS